MIDVADPIVLSPALRPWQRPRWSELPQLLRDLVILAKPGVAALLVVTAVATAWAAGGPSTSPWQILALALAGGLTAGGAGALNQYLDRDLDARMARTSLRPIPSGRLPTPELAAAWGGALVAGGLLLAALTLPLEAALFILLGFLIYVPLYTGLLKRRTPWNVVIGGAAGSCPVLAGWVAVRGDWPVAPLALAAVVFFWSPAHFWAFAMMYEDEYRAAWVPMLPALIGSRRTPPYIFAHAVPAVLAALIAVGGFLAGAPLPVIAVVAGVVAAAGLGLLGKCLALWRDPSSARARMLYRFSNHFLALVFVSIAAGARFA